MRCCGTFLHFRLISHVGYIINCDKRFRIKFVDKIHQLLVFGLVYDRDDFFALLHVIGTIGFIDRSTAVQLMKNKFPKFFFLWSDDTYPAFDIMIKNKIFCRKRVLQTGQRTYRTAT